MSFANAKEIAVDRSDVIPTIAIDVGQAQFGSYIVGLWNKQGKAFLVGSGDSDAPTRTHRIVRNRSQLAQLDDFHLTVAVSMQFFSKKPGTKWSYEWAIEQGETLLDEEAKDGPVKKQLMAVTKVYRIALT